MSKVYPVSPMQRGMFFHDMLSEHALYYNQVRFGIEGKLNLDVFRKSVQLLTDAHEVLRSRYFLSGEQTVLMEILDPSEKKQPVEFQDIRSLSEAEAEAYIEKEIKKESLRRINLETGDLMHLTLYRIREDFHILIWGCHHIALDGWCMSLLIQELFAYYDRGMQGVFEVQEEIPYSNYLKWLEENDNSSSKTYWEKYLEERPESGVLPTEKKVQSYNLERKKVCLTVSKKKMDAVKKIAARAHITESTVVQGIWGLLQCKYSNRKEAIWGCVTSGRSVPVPGAEKMMGLFINTMPVVFRLKKDASLLEQMKKLGMDIFQAEFKSHISLNEICDNPKELFHHIFAFENLKFAEMLQGVKFENLSIKDPYFYDRTNYDLTVKAQPSDELYIEWHYNPDVFDKAGIEAIASAYEVLLDQFIASPEQKVSAYRLLDSEQETKLIQEINRNYRPGNPEKTTQEGFLEIAEKYPEYPAISENGEDISYSELAESAERVAACLQNAGVKQGDVVGIDAVNGAETIQGIMGILLAGCAYLPLDEKLPERRREFFIKQTGMNVVISDKPERYRNEVRVLSLEESLSTDSGLYKKIRFQPEDIAYLIFTSGSTGEPKGVSVSSGALYQFGTLRKSSMQHGEHEDRAAQIAVLSFDASIYEIFTTFLTGGTVVVASAKDKENAENLTAFYRREHITRSFITMQLFQLMVDEDPGCFANARAISAGGERASAKHFFRMAQENPNAAMINGYGPTECICLSSGYRLSADADAMDEIPIGYPEENHTYYVLDDDGNLCPPYAEGELYIGGANASGYFGREDLTKEVFVPNPYKENDVIYRSGDIVRYIPGEGMLYLHRKDQQVKIRGFRIEAGEIENALRECRGVKQGCIKIQDQKIWGYYVAEQEISPDEIRDQLAEFLPSYMIPNALLQMPELPINKNGKLDVAALPEIEADTETAYVLPQNELQRHILEIWQNVLDNPEIGIRHNFFEFGGDSIKAMQIIGLLKKHGYHAEIRTLFQNPTVEKFSAYVHAGEMESQDAVEGDCGLLPIQREFLEQKQEGQNQFNQSALLRMRIPVTADMLAQAMGKITKQHDMLRAIYVKEADSFVQKIRPAEAVSYRIAEYSFDKEEDEQVWINKEIEELQKGMDLEKGILMQVGLFHTKTDALVFIGVHHMVMDGVSFRILLRDFGELISGIAHNQEAVLVPKTVSYQKFTAAVNEAAKGPEFTTIWENIDTEGLERIERNSHTLFLQDRKTIAAEFSESELKGMEDYIRTVKGSEMTDVLLSLTGLAIRDVLSLSNFAVDVEHNGRGFADQKYDLSNTIGWFTAIYPFVFRMENESEAALIKRVSELQKQYRTFSAEYMIAKVLQNRKQEIYRIRPEICFNYLGSFDTSAQEEEPFETVVQNLPGNRAGSHKTNYVLELNALIVKKKLQLLIDYDPEAISAEQIQQMVWNFKERAVKLGRIADEEFYKPFPLSSLQMAYFIGKQDFYELGGFTTHNYMEMETKVDIPRLNAALQKLIENQEMLRTVVVKDGTQRVLKEVPVYKIQLEDLRGLSREEQENKIQERRKVLSHYVFDISRFPMFDIGGFQLTDEDKYLFIGYDTIMMDSGSMHLMIRDLAHYYFHPEETPEPLEYHYQDYIRDWEHLKTQETYEEAKKYWMEKLETFPEAAQLPMVCDPVTVTKGHFLRKLKKYTVEEYAVLKKQAAAHKMTISALLLSVYAHTMNFYSGMDRFALNLTIFNRPTFHPDLERLYGDFTSTILLDFDLTERKSFWEESEKVQGTLGKALEHRIYDGISFSRDVMHKFRYPKTKAMMPMVFTSLLFELDVWEDVKKLGDVKWQIGQTPQVYVDFNVLEQSGELVIQMDYVSELYDEEMISSVFKSYCSILDDVAHQKEKIGLPELSEKEKQQRRAYNDTNEANPVETTPIELFLASAENYPEKTALICGKERFTYRELDHLSNRVAAELSRAGLARRPIGLYIERTPGTIINILGILKAGGCYVPILPEFPQERVKYIRETGKLGRILTAGEYKVFPDADPLSISFIPEDSAYILFTSGSTGTPKGVEIANRSVANTIMGANAAYGVGAEDVIIGMSEMSFDMSVYDIFGSLGAGGTLVMVPDIHAIEKVAELVEEHKVTVWQTVPALLQMYMGIRKPGQGTSIKHILLGGDFIPKSLAKEILEKLPQAKFMSIGGPTEIAIMDICYEVKEVKDEWPSIPYGYPIRNSQIYIMDEHGRECPNEVKGEIWAGGMGLAKQYVGMPELTAERFVQHPKYGRLFRTGDYGIFKNEGYVEICGRQDGQIKIQGMRIELGEIENVFLKHPGVSQAAAVVHEGRGGSKQIVVFAEADPEEYSALELMEYAAQYLTDYMRPSVLKIVDKIPLSGNNKIDRRSLRESLEDLQEENRIYEAPKNETEERLLEIWKDVLRVDKAGVEDDFFENGGDSLKAMELLSQIKTRMNWCDLLLTDILRAGTIRHLAEFYLSGETGSVLRELSAIQGKARKAFFIHGGNGSADSYQKIAANIAEDADCYGIDYMKSITLEPEKISLRKLAEDYAKAIRNAAEKSEEIMLVGWCIGGTISFEIARILEAAGYEKLKLLFLDTQDPGKDKPYDYTLETEIGFIKEHAFDLNIDPLLRSHSTTELWNLAVSVIESNPETEKKMKEVFRTQTAGILMNSDQLSAREVLMINNFFRSLVDNAHNTSMSGKLLHTKALYVHAKEGSVAEHPENWRTYMEQPMEIRELDCSHFGVMEKEIDQYCGWLRQ